MLTLETIKRIIDDIKSDDEWVQDSHDRSEKIGLDRGLDLLLRHSAAEGFFFGSQDYDEYYFETLREMY